MSPPQPQSRPQQPQSQPDPDLESQPDQSESQSQPQPPQPQPHATMRLPIAILVVRVIILISLIVSLIITASNTATYRGVYKDVTMRFDRVVSYRYMMSTIVVGMTYTLVQISFSIYHVNVGKPLVEKEGLLQFDFYGDKVLLSLLATGVGAGFGATVDLKKNLDDLDDLLQQNYGSQILSEFRLKLDDFFNMANVATGFLLLAFVSSIASSTLSSLALLSKKNPN